MCGIFGQINLDREPAAGAAALVARGVELLRHRGPDESGVEHAGPVCLGHARLSIIDLEGGHQPMWSCDGNGLICYNGEVYNFKELRAELQQLGRSFATRSDTEVVLNAYLEWGAGCVERLRGMFSFAVIDLKKNTALLVRDRLGIKPLFYLTRGARLFFSSELEPLYRTVGPFKLDLGALDDYLYWQYIHAPATIYQDVRSLPPGNLVEIDLQSSRCSEQRYWSLHFTEDRSLSVAEWEELLDQEMREAVRLRLVSDVPFGAFLSGGIDSSLVTGYMAEIMEQPVNTFSIGFKEADFSELKYAEQVANLNKTDHRTEIVEPESLGLLPLLTRHYGQPFADSSAIPTYYVSRMARKYVKMILSGDGGDENFAGYNSYEHILRILGGKPRFDSPSRVKRFKALAYYYGKMLIGKVLDRELLDSAYELHCMTAQHFPPSERKNLFRECYRDAVRSHHPHRRAHMDVAGGAPLVTRLQHIDLMAYLPFDILTKVDIASMANSLEVRVPLLDHKLVELAATIPAEFKLKQETIDGKLEYEKKFLLKQVAKRRYPASIIDRPKMGFGIPLGIWFATRLNGELRKRLLKSEYLPELFNVSAIENLVDSHSETSDYSARLWNLVFLEEWLRSHPEVLN